MSGGNHGEDTKNKVVQFVTENAADLLGVNPIVIPISDRDGLACKLMKSSKERKLYDIVETKCSRSTMSGWTTEMMQSVDEYKEDMVGVLRKEGGRCQGLVERMSYWDQWSWFVLSSGEKFEREWNVVRSGSGGEDNHVE
eukprot:8177613-Ditylum_brightwellii.AAC.1